MTRLVGVFVYGTVIGLIAQRALHAPTWREAIFFALLFWVGLAVPIGRLLGHLIHQQDVQPYQERAAQVRSFAERKRAH